MNVCGSASFLCCCYTAKNICHNKPCTVWHSFSFTFSMQVGGRKTQTELITTETHLFGGTDPLIRRRWSIVQIAKKWWLLLCDGHFLQRAAHSLHFPLVLALCLPPSLPLSFSVSSYYPNPSPAVTLHHYLPLIFPLLPPPPLLSLFALPSLLPLTCISPQMPPCLPEC